MDPIKFGQDLARKAELVHSLGSLDFAWPDLRGQSLVFTGMGSSTFASEAITTMLQAAGLAATTSLASNPTPPLPDAQKTLIAISASGTSKETIAALDLATGYREKLIFTNSDLPFQNKVSIGAGFESGGVASLTYTATIIGLLRLSEQLGAIDNLTALIDRAADAIEHITSTQNDWLDSYLDLSLSGSGTHFVAPQNRLCSAQQSALMLREGPRLPAVACETGDWSHIDVYLTKVQDYRLVLFPGSTWEDQLFQWTNERKSTVITMGFDHPHAAASFRYTNDDEWVVRLLAETSFSELASQRLWQTQQN
ncbi:MAG: iron dicitrate transport regulator FecR [Streptomycetaceae bacterium]|nr:MAG: iron dicitrate transport regulator FecR [Streptomycetaceae bacterium]